MNTKYMTIYQPVTMQLLVSVSLTSNSKRIHMYERLVSYFETSPLKRRLYLSVWCTSLSRVRQEMSIPEANNVQMQILCWCFSTLLVLHVQRIQLDSHLL